MARTDQPEEITYKCRKCGEKDHDRGINLPRPMALTCWNCKAGYNLSISEMLSSGQGMFPQK